MEKVDEERKKTRDVERLRCGDAVEVMLMESICAHSGGRQSRGGAK